MRRALFFAALISTVFGLNVRAQQSGPSIPQTPPENSREEELRAAQTRLNTWIEEIDAEYVSEQKPENFSVEPSSEANRCQGRLNSCADGEASCITQFYPELYSISTRFRSHLKEPALRKKYVYLYFAGKTRTNEHHDFIVREILYRFIPDEDLRRNTYCDNIYYQQGSEEKGMIVRINLPMSFLDSFMEDLDRHKDHLRIRLVYVPETSSSIGSRLESGVIFKK